MRFHPFVAIALVVAVGTLGCQPAAEEPAPEAEAAPTTEADAEAIEQAHQEAISAFNAGDVDALMAFWTDEPVYMPPDVPALQGKEAIREFYGQLLAGMEIDSLSSEEVVVAGDWAFERGSVSATMILEEGGEAEQVSAKYLDVWQRQADGSWKVARAIWNFDGQPAGEEEPAGEEPAEPEAS